MKTLRTAAALAAAALSFAAPAQAQFPTLRVGERASGQLQAGDPALYEGGRFKVYSFQAQAGRRYAATMESGDFDAFLTLARTVGGITDRMMMDDDGGGDTNARVRFSVPESGTYLLIAQSLAEDGMGAFTVGLDTLPATRRTVADLRVGQTVQGEIAETDPEMGFGEGGITGFYDLYRLRGTPGQRVRVQMDMAEYFPTLTAGAMDGDEYVPEMFAQNGSQLLLAIPPSGELLVQAGVEGGVIGPYTLRVEERTPAVVPAAQPIRAGAPVSAALEETDGEDEEDGRWYDLYSYSGRGGESISVTMESDEFDTVLAVGRMVDGRWEEIAGNDDAEGGENTNSAVEVQVPADGRLLIRATSFSTGAAGRYQVRVTAR